MYPRTYLLPHRRKVFYLTMGMIGVALCVAALGSIGWFAATEAKSENTGLVVGGLSVTLVLLIAAAWSVAGTLKRHLVLTANELHVYGVLTRQVLRRSSIQQFRVVGRTSTLILEVQEPQATRMRKVSVSLEYQLDAVFEKWFDGLTNPDVIEMEESVQQVEKDERLGASVEERFTNLQRSRKIASYFLGMSLVLPLWAVFFPRPYWLVVGLLLIGPWIAMFLCWLRPGWFSLEDLGDNSVRADLSLSLFAGFTLTLRAFLDIQLVEISRLLLPALCGLLVMTACVVGVEPEYRKQPAKIVLLMLVLVGYPVGAIAILNTELDRAQPTLHRLQVLEKSDASNYHDITVPPWGPRAGIDSVTVSRRLHAGVQVGGEVCVYQYPGALGLAWYDVKSALPC